jgi:hypothetical protein
MTALFQIDCNSEIFVQIPNYSNYIVSNCGRVFSTNYNKSGKTVEMRLSTNRYGYKNVELYDDNKKSRRLSVHRLVANAFIPKVVGRNFVNHKDGIKANNLHSNLEWVTLSENTRHSYDVIKTQSYKRLSDIGKDVGIKLRRFSPEEVRTIKDLHFEQGKSYRNLALMYGCCKTVIERLVNGITYF